MQRVISAAGSLRRRPRTTGVYRRFVVAFTLAVVALRAAGADTSLPGAPSTPAAPGGVNAHWQPRCEAHFQVARAAMARAYPPFARAKITQSVWSATAIGN